MDAEKTTQESHRSSSPLLNQVHLFFDELQKIQKEEEKLQKKYARNFLIYGIILLIIGGLSLFHLTSVDLSTIGIVMSMLVMIVYVRFFRSNGIHKLKKRITSFFNEITNLVKQNRKEHSHSKANPDELLNLIVDLHIKRPRPRLLGVCALLSELSGTSVTTIRIAFLLGLWFSGGWILLPYLVLAFMKPFLEKEATKAIKERYQKQIKAKNFIS